MNEIDQKIRKETRITPKKQKEQKSQTRFDLFFITKSSHNSRFFTFSTS